MIVIAHFVAISLYIAAAALAALPFARRVNAPVNGVIAALVLGISAHAIALLTFARESGSGALTGLGPALSFAGFVLAVALLLVEAFAREVSVALIAAPLAALMLIVANVFGLQPLMDPQGSRAVWLVMHIVLSFAGMAAYATAAAAGTMYLIAHRDLKSARFGAIFRFFPPLNTLDRVNHFASIAGFLALTTGLALAAAYSIAYRTVVLPQLVWGLGAWVCIGALALGRMLRGLQARRAAVLSAITFASVMVVYVVFRVSTANRGQFL
jgi:HemX protein